MIKFLRSRVSTFILILSAPTLAAYSSTATAADSAQFKTHIKTQKVATTSLKSLTALNVEQYLGNLSSLLIGRPLVGEELELIQTLRHLAIPKILSQWAQNPRLADALAIMINSQLRLGGTRDGIDWDLPANLAKYLVLNRLPYSQILTADHCVDTNGKKISCDSDAPYISGILTTRAYLIRFANRFNLSRGTGMIRHFACLNYPLPTELEPRLPRQSLITLFQKDVDGGPSFGNGTNCYSCHSQFGSHAQYFVKFDQMGKYNSNATGIQDPGSKAEIGRSLNNTFASHLGDNLAAGSEKSQMFGTPVSNLKEAAKVLASHSVFLNCAVRNTLRYVLKMSDVNANQIPEIMIREISGRIKKKYSDPTWSQIVEFTFNDATVIESVLEGGK